MSDKEKVLERYPEAKIVRELNIFDVRDGDEVLGWGGSEEVAWNDAICSINKREESQRQALHNLAARNAK